ncbi:MULTISPECIES: hypothetical protein [Bacteria]|uniref:hypothetical protein n=1 Tax=Bacteria TaxID=2 RepID=UPI00332D6CA0
MAVLRAAGIPKDKMRPLPAEDDAAPARSYRAFLDWFRRAQRLGRIGACDVDALASTILGSLYHRATMAGVCGHADASREAHVEALIGLLWSGIGVSNRLET